MLAADAFVVVTNNNKANVAAWTTADNTNLTTTWLKDANVDAECDTALCVAVHTPARSCDAPVHVLIAVQANAPPANAGASSSLMQRAPL